MRYAEGLSLAAGLRAGVVAERNEAAVARVRSALEAELGQLDMAEGEEALIVRAISASGVQDILARADRHGFVLADIGANLVPPL